MTNKTMKDTNEKKENQKKPEIEEGGKKKGRRWVGGREEKTSGKTSFYQKGRKQARPAPRKPAKA